MPSCPELRVLLPFMANIYGSDTVMTHYFPGRSAEQVLCSEGTSQGAPEGGFMADLPLQACLHGVASAFNPDLDFNIWALHDDVTIGGPKSFVFNILDLVQSTR